MQLSDDDRVTYRPPHRSTAFTAVLLLLAAAGIGGIAYYYMNNPDNNQQLSALKQSVNDKVQPTAAVTPPSPVIEQIVVEPDPVLASEPPLEATAEAVPLPPLDTSDVGIRQELTGLTGWQTKTLDWLVSDQLLRRFVTLVTNLAIGKVDHKSGPFLPIKGRFAVSSSVPLTMTTESQARYNLYVEAITALDPQQCAALYRRYYPLLNNAYQELGEKNNFHALMLKALQQLENTPDLTQAPALAPAEKGMYKYVQPQLEALPAVQKQMLRSGWENVSKLKVWLRQFRAALLAPPV